MILLCRLKIWKRDSTKPSSIIAVVNSVSILVFIIVYFILIKVIYVTSCEMFDMVIQ